MNKKEENKIIHSNSVEAFQKLEENIAEKRSSIVSVKKPKKGKVILIPNDSTVIINLGWDEVSVGSKIKVYEVLTNITNEEGLVLGEYKFIKANLTVVEVQKNFSVCKNLIKKKSSIGLILSSNIENEYEYAKILVNEQHNLNLTPNNPQISLNDPIEL